MKGDSGPVGKPGYPGESGTMGDKGEKGERGMPGEKGVEGYPGDEFVFLMKLKISLMKIVIATGKGSSKVRTYICSTVKKKHIFKQTCYKIYFEILHDKQTNS